MSDNTSPALHFDACQFVTSAQDLRGCPADTGAEVAFAGRSNAGKSTAINALTRNRRMARTSKTPGRTQLINFFEISADQRLVDLPGYGYAKVPLKTKQAWQKNMEEYLRYRQSLRGLVLLSDIRHALHDFDKAMLEWAVVAEMPVHILLTKADKLKRGPAKNTWLAVRREVARYGDAVSAQIFSATSGEGLPELEQRLCQWLILDDTTSSSEPDD